MGSKVHNKKVLISLNEFCMLSICKRKRSLRVDINLCDDNKTKSFRTFVIGNKFKFSLIIIIETSLINNDKQQ